MSDSRKRPASQTAEAAATAAGEGGKKARTEDVQGGEKYAYNSGFGNEFATEALEGALPVGQNSPQVVSDSMASTPTRLPLGIVCCSALTDCTLNNCQEQPSQHLGVAISGRELRWAARMGHV